MARKDNYIYGQNNTYPLGIVGPGGPLHFALLNIKGEVFDTDVTGALVDPMGQPYDFTVTLNYDIGVNYSRTVTRIGTENENNTYYRLIIMRSS